jgi:hypothetical protein
MWLPARFAGRGLWTGQVAAEDVVVTGAGCGCAWGKQRRERVLVDVVLVQRVVIAMIRVLLVEANHCRLFWTLIETPLPGWTRGMGSLDGADGGLRAASDQVAAYRLVCIARPRGLGNSSLICSGGMASSRAFLFGTKHAASDHQGVVIQSLLLVMTEDLKLSRTNPILRPWTLSPRCFQSNSSTVFMFLSGMQDC